MAELKTRPQDTDVMAYLNELSVEKKSDAQILIEMMEKITNEKAVIWGTSIIGFGQKRFKYQSGREIDYFLLGFSVRKHALTMYLTISTNQQDFTKLGPHTKGVGCLYIKRLSDIDLNELHFILETSWNEAKRI